MVKGAAMKNEAALIVGAITSALVAVLQASTAAGFTWSTSHVIAIVAPLLSAFLIRGNVYSQATVDKISPAE